MDGIPFIFRRRSMAGSLIGGLPETQEMLDFCGEHDITCDIETIVIKGRQHGLRPHRQGRCEISFRDRHGLPSTGSRVSGSAIKAGRQ